MRLQLDPEWLIDCDDMSCQLIHLKTITAEGGGRGKHMVKAENIGKIREEGMGFYGRLDQALQAYVVKSMQNLEGHKTAAELGTYMHQCMQYIAQAVSKLPPRGV